MSALTTLILLCALITLCVIVSIFSPLTQRISTVNTRTHALGMAGVILFGSIALYSYLGTWNSMNELDAAHSEDTALRASLPTLAAASAKEPKSLDARVAYARALGKSGDHAKATEEFRAAVLLSGGRPDLILDFATAQILSADGMVSDEAIKSIDMVLIMAPKEPKARYFKAIYAKQQGKNLEAATQMQAILNELPAYDPLYATIQTRLRSLSETPKTNMK